MQTKENVVVEWRQQRAKIWDEEERLRYLSPERDCFNRFYVSFPLRITHAEWEELTGTDRDFDDRCFCHHRFTLCRSLVFHHKWDYCDVFEVTLSNGRNRVFGPYKNPLLAAKKTLEFLIEQNAIELVECVK